MRLESEGYKSEQVADQLATLACFGRPATFALESELPKWSDTGPVQFRDAWEEAPADVAILSEDDDGTGGDSPNLQDVLSQRRARMHGSSGR